MSRLQEIIDSKPDIKIVDSLLHSGVIRFNNLNDKINCVNRVAPNLTSEQADMMFQQIENLGVKEDALLKYELSDETPDNALITFPIGSLYLSFFLQESDN